MLLLLLFFCCCCCCCFVSHPFWRVYVCSATFKTCCMNFIEYSIIKIKQKFTTFHCLLRILVFTQIKELKKFVKISFVSSQIINLKSKLELVISVSRFSVVSFDGINLGLLIDQLFPSLEISKLFIITCRYDLFFKVKFSC